MSLHSLQIPRVVNDGHVQLLPEGQVNSAGGTEVNRPAYAARAISVSEQLLLPNRRQLVSGWYRTSVRVPFGGSGFVSSRLTFPNVEKPGAWLASGMLPMVVGLASPQVAQSLVSEVISESSGSDGGFGSGLNDAVLLVPLRAVYKAPLS